MRQSSAELSANIQRTYLIAPYVDLSLHFNGLEYSDLRTKIERYKQGRERGLNVKQDRLGELIAILNVLIVRPRLSQVQIGYFTALRNEIIAEQRRLTGEAPNRTRSPILSRRCRSTRTRSPILSRRSGQSPAAGPGQREPAAQSSAAMPVNPQPQVQVNPNPQPNPQPQVPVNPQPQVQVNPQPQVQVNPQPQVNVNPQPQVKVNPQPRGVAPLSANPQLLPEHQAQLGVEQRIIAANVTMTNTATGESFSYGTAHSGSRLRFENIASWTLAGGSAIRALPLQWRVPATPALTGVSGSKHTVPSGGWTLNQGDVQPGTPPRVRAGNVWYTLDVASDLRPVSLNSTGAWELAADDVRQSQDGRQVRSDGTWYQVVEQGNLTSRSQQHEVIDLGDGLTVRVEAKPENISGGAVGFKRLGNTAPLFPSPPTGGDIKQLGLGDCYLQAVLISIATQNPAHLQNMLRDNGDGSVSVKFYTVDETNASAPAFAAEDIRVEKSVPENGHR